MLYGVMFVNALWGGMIVIGILVGMLTGRGEARLDAMIAGAADAVTLAISLGGAYMFFMGIMGVARECGLIDSLAKLVRPLMKRLFPNAGAAVAPITLNLAANFFGLGNAATPFGLEAMKELQKSNREPSRATDDMCMFIALNASAIELLPTSVLALRAAAGSADAYSVIWPTFASSVVGFVAAVLLCMAFRRRRSRR